MPLGVPANALGLIVSGDVAHVTIYTDRHGRKVEYPIAPPTKPPSRLQRIQRDRFRRAQAAWMALSDADKATLERVVANCSLALTGQNLYIALALRNNLRLQESLSRHTGLTVPAIPWIDHGGSD